MTSLTLGYKASNEQFGPQELLALTQHAEARGFEVAGVSDHLQPWRHNGGHAPAVLPWLGAAAATTSTITLGTSVLTPTMRYHPAIIAQAFATLGCLAPGRIFLGVGTGEAMNETPITGGEFPGRKERRMKMAEAIKVIKQLWAEERVDFEGEYYKLRARHDLRPARDAGADLRRGVRPARGQARRPRRRRLHLHLRQGPGALRQPARRTSRKARRRPAATTSRSSA